MTGPFSPRAAQKEPRSIISESVLSATQCTFTELVSQASNTYPDYMRRTSSQLLCISMKFSKLVLDTTIIIGMDHIVLTSGTLARTVTSNLTGASTWFCGRTFYLLTKSLILLTFDSHSSHKRSMQGAQAHGLGLASRLPWQLNTCFH